MAAKSGANPAPNSGEWEEINPFTQALDMKAGDSFIAEYLGGSEKEVDDPNSPEAEGKRVTLFHEFREDSGSEPFGVWGSAGLDKRLAELAIGTRVKVQYDGLVDLKGGRTARQYRVWADRNQPF